MIIGSQLPVPPELELLLEDELLEEELELLDDELELLLDDELELLLDDELELPPLVLPKLIYPLQCSHSLLPPPPHWLLAQTPVFTLWFSAWRVSPSTWM